MAIFPNLDASAAASNAAPQAVDIAAWTEQTVEAFNELSLNAQKTVQGTSVSLAIDLDENGAPKSNRNAGDSRPGHLPRREPMRRDSLKRREALLKGKEGSRRRRQWENDRLLSNPWAQPPLPSDWEVHPTYPRHAVPYYLAPLWDQDAAARVEARETAKLAAKKKMLAEDETYGQVPREVREKLRKAKAAKGLLRDLEEQVRAFVKGWEEKTKAPDNPSVDSEDEEIVFVGRNGHMHDVPPSPKFRDSMDDDVDAEKEHLVFDSLANDRGASFGRWLVHSIASYYGLRTWSVTVGNPARREAYVGIPLDMESSRPVSPILPRPLWGMV